MPCSHEPAAAGTLIRIALARADAAPRNDGIERDPQEPVGLRLADAAGALALDAREAETKACEAAVSQATLTRSFRSTRPPSTTGLSAPEELVDDAPLLEEDRFDVFVPVAIHDSIPANSQSIEATPPASQLLHVAAALGELTERAPDVASVIWMNRAQASEDLLGDEHLHLGKSSTELHIVFPAS